VVRPPVAKREKYTRASFSTAPWLVMAVRLTIPVIDYLLFSGIPAL
jgi:hypothetical protein